MSFSELFFLKLGGSLITDKLAVEVAREETLRRLATEIASARQQRPEISLVLGHGSGSFGHSVAARYQTQSGVRDTEQWMGFCKVSAAAARLNRLVGQALLDAGVPVVTLQPSASAVCDDGLLVELSATSVEAALHAGVVPLLYGDVAFDRVRGGTIISTEQVLGFLAHKLHPEWLLLGGNTSGVYDTNGKVVTHITGANFAGIREALGGSAGTDVTGGMASKVRDMLALAEQHQGLSMRIFSGLEPGRLRDILLDPQQPAGTLITA